MLAAQTVSSVLLAVLLADGLNLTDRWWVAISAYVVMRADWTTSWRRAVQRMIGTVGGAGLCLLVAPWVRMNLPLYAIAFAAVAGVGLYLTLGSRRSYAWLLATITASLVLSEAPASADLAHTATMRALDVGVGTAACIGVSGLVHVGRPYLHLPLLAGTQDAESPDARNPDARRARIWQALPSALCVGMLAALHFRYPLVDFAQMLVTVIVVPVIPLATLLGRDQNEMAVTMRMVNRVLGCLLAALFAVLFLPWTGGHPLLFLLALAVGIWLASHVHSGHADTSYVGLQFGIAFLMVFVQDQAWSNDLRPALLRLLGILTGVLLLAVIRLVVAYVRRRAASVSG